MLRRNAGRVVRRADRVVAAAFVLGAAVQLLGMLGAPEGPARERSTVLDIARLVALRVYGTVLVGDRALDDLWFDLRDVLAVGAVVIVLGAMAALARRCPREAQLHAALAVGSAMVIAVLSLRIRGTERFAVSGTRFVFDADRYFLIPSFLVVSALVILVRSASLPRYAAPLVAAHLVLVVVGTGFNAAPAR